MTNLLKLTIEGSVDLVEHGEKPDGTLDIRTRREIRVCLSENNTLILWEQIFPREKLPIDFSRHLADLIARNIAAVLPRLMVDE